MQGSGPAVTGGGITLPANWETLIAEADIDLGACEGGVCAI